MANEKHLYLTVEGGYIGAATPLQQETWQFGLRLALVFGDLDDLGTFPSNWNPSAASINRVETDWTIQGNWYVKGPLATDFAVDDWLDSQVGGAVRTFLNAANSGTSASVQLRTIKVYPIGTDGRAIPAPPYAVGTPITLAYTGTLPTGGTSGSEPPNVSAVVSLQTDQIGRRGRGRFYTPMRGGPVAGTGATAGIMSSTQQTNLGAAAATLLEALAQTGTLPVDPTVRPVVTGVPWVNYGVVKSIRIGRVLDVQNRRRRSIPELYVPTAVSY